jgi:hypothetical protein
MANNKQEEKKVFLILHGWQARSIDDGRHYWGPPDCYKYFNIYNKILISRFAANPHIGRLRWFSLTQAYNFVQRYHYGK